MSPYKLSSAVCGLARYQSSPAALFVRQCRRSLSSASSPSATASRLNAAELSVAVPEFLLPSARSTLRFDRRPSPPRSLPYLRTREYRSRFSTTAVYNAATVVQNPRVDEDGNSMWMEISPRAAERLRQITQPSTSDTPTTKENPHDHLRVTVTSGGCHGFQYTMSLEPSSKIDPEEDTVFEAESSSPEESGSAESNDGDAGGNAKVVMDEPSLELLTGSTVDYTMELIGSQFKIVNNPRASSNCGCGTSFDVQ